MKNSKFIKNIAISFFSAGFLFVIFVYLWILGVSDLIVSKIDYLGRNFQGLNKSLFFSSSFFSSYIFVIVSFTAGALVFLEIKNKIFKACLYVLVSLSLLLLIFIDFLIIWILLLIVSFIASYLLDKKKKGCIPKLYLYISIIAIFFSFLQVNNFINSFKKNINSNNNSAMFFVFDRISFLNFKSNSFGFNDSFKIAKESFKENWFIGSGQGTFTYNVSKYGGAVDGSASPEMIRSNNPSNYFFMLVSNSGLLGILVYFVFISLFFIISFHILYDNLTKDYAIYRKNSFILISIISVIFANLFLLPNIFLTFIFWILLAIMMIEIKKDVPQFFSDKIISRDVENNQENKINIYPLANLLFVVIIVILSGFYTIIFRYHIADYNYKEYLINSAKASEELKEAIRLNPYFEDYSIKLAENSLAKISFELGKENEEDKDLSVLGEESARSIEIIKRNLKEHPNSVRAWEIAGNVYKNVSPFIKKGVQEWIIKSFENALEFEPHNLFFKLEIAKAYLLEGTTDGVDNEKVNKSIDLLNSITDKCLNNRCLYYTEAKFYLAKALEAKGKNKQAIEELQDINIDKQEFIDENDPNVLFELGRIYFNNEELDKAKKVLEEVLRIKPNYSNALYTLASVYEKQGNIGRAITLLEKVKELNQDNSEILEKIDSLKKL
ncbi:tetratricopeptide repeat protein [Patescibacteria group bacterium]